MLNLKESFGKAFLINEISDLNDQIINPPSQIQLWQEWSLSRDDILFKKRESAFIKKAKNNLLKYQSWQKLRIAGVGMVGLVSALTTIALQLATR